MRRAKGILVLMLVLLLALALNTPVVGADSPVRVAENRGAAQFGKNLSFRLVAEHDQNIKGVTLFYRRQKGRVTTRVVPAFSPGQRIVAVFDKTVERGEIPPGTVYEYYWRLDLVDGTRVDTSPQTFTYDDDRFNWQTVQADSLSILYYGNDRNASQAQELLKRGQAALARLQSEVGITLRDPVHVYVYRTAGDMADVLSPRSEGFDQQITTLGVAVSEDTLLLLGSHANVQLTLAHELSHIVVGQATQNPYSSIPRWLDEGLAMYAEGVLRAGNARALSDAVKGDALISVRSLSGYTGDASKVDLYYGEVYSLIDYLLRSQGRDKMTAFLRAFREGSDTDAALENIYGLTQDSLDARWRASLGLQPRPTSGPTAVSTPRPTPAGASKRRTFCAGQGVLGVLGAGIFLSRRWAKENG